MSPSPYSVAAPVSPTGAYFVNTGGNLGPAANAYLRSDMTNGMSNTASDYTPEATQELLAAITSGQVRLNRPDSQAIVDQLRAGTIGGDQLAALSPSRY